MRPWPSLRFPRSAMAPPHIDHADKIRGGIGASPGGHETLIMKLRVCILVGLLVPVPVAGCGRDRQDAPTAPAVKSTTYTLRGVVRKVDGGSGEVTIAHEAIPGFMPAM